MSKWKSIIALAAAASFVLAGCAGGSDGEKNTGESKQEENTENSLVVYSPQGDEKRGTWIIEKAKAEIGLDIQFLCAGGGELSDRLIAEKNNPQADVIMGMAQNAMYKLKDEDILEQYEPAWVEGLPEVYRGKDGYFNSFWQTPIVLAYNPDYIPAEDAPTSWADLADPRYEGKFGFAATTSQTTRTYLIGLLWDYVDSSTGEVSDEGWNFLKTVYQNAGTMPSNEPDIWKAFKDGTLPIVPWWYGGVVSNCKTNEIPVEFVIPKEGTPVVAEAVGLVKGSSKADDAKKFIDWWGSAETMSAYAAEFGQAPAHPDAIALCPEDISADASKFTAQEIDWEIASEQLDSWLEKIELEIMP